MKIVEQSATLLWVTPDPLFAIERAGRICYKSEDRCHCDECGRTPAQTYADLASDATECKGCYERALRFVMGIIKRGHESVLEHACASVVLVTDRGMTHEVVRHRIVSYAQESTRYCNYGNDSGEITVIKPDLSEDRGNMGKCDWDTAMAAAEESYMNLIEAGVSPQWARSVLPTCLKTEIAVTTNLREWRHMMGLRLGNRAGKAHPQIRALFKMILDQFMGTQVAPLFEEFANEA